MKTDITNSDVLWIVISDFLGLIWVLLFILNIILGYFWVFDWLFWMFWIWDICGVVVLPASIIYKNIYTKEAIISHLRLDEVVDLVNSALGGSILCVRCIPGSLINTMCHPVFYFWCILWDLVIRLAFAILCVGSCSCSCSVFRSLKMKRDE